MTAERATIIAFHAIEEGHGPICMPPSVFERQIKTLLDGGFTILRVDELVSYFRRGEIPPPRTVALTFDDAYASVHEHALPVLDPLGVRATVFPVTSELGGYNRWDAGRGAPPLRLVSHTQLTELADAGWEVGGHTHTHTSLAGLSPRRVQHEIATSTSILEALYGQPLRTFAYPYGDHDPVSVGIAGASHESCLTIGASQATPQDPLDRLPRVEAWYLRQSWQLRTLRGPRGRAYLASRAAGRWAGRAARRPLHKAYRR